MSYRCIYGDKLAAARRFINIGLELDRIEVGESKLLGSFAVKGFGKALAIADVPCDGNVPVKRIGAFDDAAQLEIDFAVAVDQVKVHHGVKQHASAMAQGPGGPSDDDSVGFHDREDLSALGLAAALERGYVKGVNQFHLRER